MPKIAYLANHFSSNELKQKYLRSQDFVESRRGNLLGKVSLGWTLKSSAIAVGISYDYAKEILKKYNELSEEGVKNIKNKHRDSRGGKKSLLNERQLEKLAQELKLRPADGGIWTGSKVVRWIEKENGVEKIWNLIGWDYLKKLKYSCQRPRSKHRKGNPLEQAEFIITLPLKIKTVQQQDPEAEIDVCFSMNIEWD